MPLNPDNLQMLLTIGALFALLAAVWIAGVFLWGMRLKKRDLAIEERLGLIVPTEGPTRVLRLWHDDHFEETIVGTGNTRGGMVARLKRLHAEAGMSVNAGQVLMMLIVGAVAIGGGLFVVTQSPLVGAGATVMVPLAYITAIKQRASKRSGMFDNQISSSLELVGRSLRAGHPLLASFHLITEELDDPIRSIFADILQQHELGVSLDDAIQRVAAQNTSSDLRLFATALSIQLRSGGNLAEVMDRLAFVIRERMRLGRRVKVLTAQTQLSKRILLGFPFVMFFVIHSVNPKYGSVLIDTPSGRGLLIAGLVSMTLGALVMNRLAVLKY